MVPRARYNQRCEPVNPIEKTAPCSSGIPNEPVPLSAPDICVPVSTSLGRGHSVMPSSTVSLACATPAQIQAETQACDLPETRLSYGDTITADPCQLQLQQPSQADAAPPASATEAQGPLLSVEDLSPLFSAPHDSAAELCSSEDAHMNSFSVYFRKFAFFRGFDRGLAAAFIRGFDRGLAATEGGEVRGNQDGPPPTGTRSSVGTGSPATTGRPFRRARNGTVARTCLVIPRHRVVAPASEGVVFNCVLPCLYTGARGHLDCHRMRPCEVLKLAEFC